MSGLQLGHVGAERVGLERDEAALAALRHGVHMHHHLLAGSEAAQHKLGALAAQVGEQHVRARLVRLQVEGLRVAAGRARRAADVQGRLRPVADGAVAGRLRRADRVRCRRALVSVRERARGAPGCPSRRAE